MAGNVKMGVKWNVGKSYIVISHRNVESLTIDHTGLNLKNCDL